MLSVGCSSAICARPTNRKQMLRAADIPADRRAVAVVDAANVHVVDAAHELIIHGEFSFLPQPAAFFVPDERTAIDMGRRRGQLLESLR